MGPRLIGVRYFHQVFTMPHLVMPIAISNNIFRRICAAFCHRDDVMMLNKVSLTTLFLVWKYVLTAALISKIDSMANQSWIVLSIIYFRLIESHFRFDGVIRIFESLV